MYSLWVTSFSRVFFFMQKTAYEMLRSLVGSEMCIRDRRTPSALLLTSARKFTRKMELTKELGVGNQSRCCTCLLYTYDAADDLPCVDLGGRRIIKKKNDADVTPSASTYIDRTLY